jgi:hypothetical protein
MYTGISIDLGKLYRHVLNSCVLKNYHLVSCQSILLIRINVSRILILRSRPSVIRFHLGSWLVSPSVLSRE